MLNKMPWSGSGGSDIQVIRAQGAGEFGLENVGRTSADANLVIISSRNPEGKAASKTPRGKI